MHFTPDKYFAIDTQWHKLLTRSHIYAFFACLKVFFLILLNAKPECETIMGSNVPRPKRGLKLQKGMITHSRKDLIKPTIISFKDRKDKVKCLHGRE